MNGVLKKTQDGVTKHVQAIDRIAASLRIPREEVRALYERVLEEMAQKARIKTFLSIFAVRRVEELLRAMYSDARTDRVHQSEHPSGAGISDSVWRRILRYD